MGSGVCGDWWGSGVSTVSVRGCGASVGFGGGARNVCSEPGLRGQGGCLNQKAVGCDGGIPIEAYIRKMNMPGRAGAALFLQCVGGSAV